MRPPSRPPVPPHRRAAAPLALALLAAGAAACGGGGSDSPAAPPEPASTVSVKDTVFMPGNSFSPFQVTIKAGQSVAWAFPNVAHNVIFPKQPGGQPIAGAPADILPVSNRVITRQFATAGTFPYDCTLHAGMRGEVVVQR